MANNKPYLSAAFLCEKVLQEKDGVLSVVRVVDIFYVTIPPEMPAGMKPVTEITGLLSFKRYSSGTEPEKHQLQLLLHSPSGREQKLPSELEIIFKAEDMAGANVILNVRLVVEEFGLFWLDVLIDEEFAARVPFRLLEKPAPPTQTIH
jgi:hypothetical protein